MKINKIQSFFDDLAPTFDREQEILSSCRIPEKKIISQTLEKILNSNLEVLEIGAGTGRFTLKIAPYVKNITAVDISQNMLNQMATKMRDQNINNIDQIHENFMEIDFNIKKFDLIVSFSTIEYLKEKEQLFKKLSFLLKPGGSIIITTSHNTFIRLWARIFNYFRQSIFLAAFTKKEIERLLSLNGFKVIEIKDLYLKNFFFKGLLLFVHAKK